MQNKQENDEGAIVRKHTMRMGISWIIIVGVVIIIGMQIYTMQMRRGNRKGLTEELNKYGTQAMQYYMTPSDEIGGGTKSFSALALNKYLEFRSNLKHTKQGVYHLRVSQDSTIVTIIGTGLYPGKDKQHPIRATLTVAPVTPTPLLIETNN